MIMHQYDFKSSYFWSPEPTKVEWEAEPSAVKLLSCGTFFLSQSRKPTKSLISDFNRS